VREKYGEDHVAQIITFSKMKARAAIRDAARVLNEPYGVGDRLAKQIVEVSDAEREKIKREYAGSLIEYSLQMNPELREEYETREDAKRILDAAKRIEGLSRTDSIHAAGVVISPEPLTTYVPLQRKSDNGKADAETVTQYDMNAVAELGLLKMDFLGLKTLTVITKTIEMIRRTRQIDIDIDTIPFDDPEAFELFRAADTVGVFQVESAGMRRLLTALGPTSFAEIVALIALFRPGPLGSGMADDFVNRKHGRNKVQFPHPMLEEILAETYGTIVYQEQVMQIAQVMGGFTPGEADDLRKAMGKKKADVMAKQKEQFVSGAVAAGVTEKVAAKVFDDIEYFAGYGFNKSHSAAYAVISYQTAYLKSHYRPEFMAALLTSIMSNKDDVLKYVNDCKAAQIPVLPPDVNESGTEFAVVDGRIRFALTAIRNVGLGLAESIVAERDKGGRFPSIFEFCSRVDPGLLNKRALESLVKAGAFDSCGHTRKHNLAVYEQACDGGAQRQRDAESGQVSIFDLGEEHDIDMGDVEPPADPTELERDDLLALEKEMLGVYVSDHPLTGLEEALRRATDYSISDFKEAADQTIGWIAGIASEVKKKATKRGDLMLTLRLEDLEGSIEVTVFPRTYQECGALCADDALLRIKAKLDERDEGHPIALAQEIEALSTDADAYPARGPLRIHVKGDDVDVGTIDTLKRTLTRFVGDIDVFLHVLHDDTIEVFRLGPAYRVDATEKLLAAVNELLGYDACALG
jgi:DNA polymerase-3 subunit alpha